MLLINQEVFASGQSEDSRKENKAQQLSTTISLQSSPPEHQAHFGLGLGQPMVILYMFLLDLFLLNNHLICSYMPNLHCWKWHCIGFCRSHLHGSLLWPISRLWSSSKGFPFFLIHAHHFSCLCILFAMISSLWKLPYSSCMSLFSSQYLLWR